MPKLVLTDREYLRMTRADLEKKLIEAGFDIEGTFKATEEPFKNRVTITQGEVKK